ncbi:MAG TPA: hypothetical protein VK933_02710 [Longimicrobiales bacterium]|nr:hypothetical protein [Longimicrobiales bacterium]
MLQAMTPRSERTPAGGRGVSGPFPGGRRFAFTILDDTDDATVENVKPIYDLLHELGYRTTKTVWPVACPEGSRIYFAGHTLEDPGYLEFMNELLAHGFEVAFHGATMESSVRERTVRALEVLRDRLGVDPEIHCNHGQNLENLYWGENRYRSWYLRLPLQLLARIENRPRYSGEKEGSPYYWGDVCRERFRYVRSFAFATLNTARLPVSKPYRLKSTPCVNYWFTTSDAPDVRSFNRLVTRRGIDELAASGGYCIMSTHLGKGFVYNGRVDEQVEDSLRYMAALNGWFVTASDLLEHLVAERGGEELSPWRQALLETMHVADRVRARWVRNRESAVK